MKEVKGLGPAAASELLSYSAPNEYMIFNKTITTCLEFLEVAALPKCNYQCTGKKYLETCAAAKQIAAALNTSGIREVNLLTVNYFLWNEVLPLTESCHAPSISAATPAATRRMPNLLHDEIKEKLVAIGELLGFESRSEVKIAVGAVVDVVWEVKIGNMGKAIYVFEIQTGGSIDSLILNLKKAQTNAAVQAIVAVSDEVQIEKIIRESEGVINRKSLRTWEVNDVAGVYDALIRAHESINKLSLVPESFVR